MLGWYCANVADFKQLLSIPVQMFPFSFEDILFHVGLQRPEFEIVPYVKDNQPAHG